MAETTGSATGLEDFFGNLLAYVGTLSGWTVDETITTVDSGRQCAVSKGNLYVQWRWDVSSPNTVAMYQSTGFASSTRAGTQAGDSGNGYNSNNDTDENDLKSDRCIDEMGNAAYPSYYFYTDSSATYVHVAVEITAGDFRHFGFGNLEKFGDWDTGSGGEYVYGHVGTTSTDATADGISFLLDGSLQDPAQAGDGATMRLSGLPDQGTEVYGCVWGDKDQDTSDGTDTAGNDRLKVIGGARGGPLAYGFGWAPPESSTGLSLFQPIACFYKNDVPAVPRVYLLGFQPDTRMVHLKYLAAKDTVTLGAQTWRVFPMVRRVDGLAAGDTGFIGVAYLTNP